MKRWTFNIVLTVVALMTVTGLAVAGTVVGGISYYTSHVTGEFNEDQIEDSIIVSSSGSAYLLLGKEAGYSWKTLLEQPLDDQHSVPTNWPANSQLCVQKNGTGFDVYTRDVKGKLHLFNTSQSEDMPSSV